jgi:hypothetical protein
MRIAVTGLARNCESSLPGTLRVLDELAKQCDLQCIIATNENIDRTGELLTTWATGNDRVTIIDLPPMERDFPSRVERLAHLRNITLQAARKTGGFSHMIVLDMDGPNASVDAPSLISAIASAPRGWGALFANQRRAYYDLYALRKKGWVEADVWQEVAAAFSVARRTPFRQMDTFTGGHVARVIYRKAVERCVFRRQYLIPPTAPPVPVDSAFGGLGVYDWAAIEGIWYSARSGGDAVICEHVVFHRALREAGRSLYISPSLLNDAPDQHIGRGSGRPPPASLYS